MALIALSGEAHGAPFTVLGTSYSLDMFMGTPDRFRQRQETASIQLSSDRSVNKILNDFPDPNRPNSYLLGQFNQGVNYGTRDIEGTFDYGTASNSYIGNGTSRNQIQLDTRVRIEQTAIYRYGFTLADFYGSSTQDSYAALAEVLSDGSLLVLDSYTRLPSAPKTLRKQGEILLEKGKTYSLVGRTSASTGSQTYFEVGIRLKQPVSPPPPVPEPATMSLLLGFGALALRKRRRS